MSDDELRAASLRAFQSWCRPLFSKPELLSPRAELKRLRIARLLSAVHLRTVRRRSCPAPPRSKTSHPARSFTSVDLWTASAAEVREQSTHTEVCPTCNGKAKSACQTCGGDHRVPCLGCGGSGTGISEKTGKPIKCRSCRGSRQRACPDCSTRGLATCSECDGAKVVEAWTELVETRRLDVQVEPDGQAAGGFAWARDGLDVPLDKIAEDAHVLGSISGASVDPSQLPAHLRAWAHDLWAQLAPRVASDERIVGQTLTVLEVPDVVVRYTVGAREGAVSFLGRKLDIRSSDARPLRRRARIVRGCGVALALAVSAGLSLYFARGSFFASPASAAMVACLVGASAALVWGVARKTLRRAALPQAVASAAFAAVALVAGFLARPSHAHASSLIAAGNFAAASAEIAALGDPDELHNEMVVARVLAASAYDDARRHAEELRPPAPLSSQAQTHVFELLIADVEAAVGRKDVGRAETLFADFTPEQLANARVRELRSSLLEHSGKLCIEKGDASCVDKAVASLEAEGFGTAAGAVRNHQTATLAARAEAADAEGRSDARAAVRVSKLEEASRLWSTWTTHTNRPPPKAAERTALLEKARADQRRDEAIAEARARAEERERARQEALEEKRRRAEERAAKQKEIAKQRAEERRQRAYDYSPLRCSDGTLSPSCTCGGSYRGCCSWHGGVAGCSAD